MHKLRDFIGYPLQVESLWVPAVLASSVIIGHQLWSEVPILLLISAASIILSCVFVLAKRRQQGIQQLQQHVSNSATLKSRELGLFLGAGMLSVGAQSVLTNFGNFLPFTHISGALLSGLLAGGIVISIMGIHPVVTISIIGPFLAQLEGDTNLVAMFYLCLWSLGTVASPFSGTNVIMRSQFGTPGKDLFRWNIGYVGFMWMVVSGVFVVWSRFNHF